MEFKNLADVTKLEEVPEGASVLAATADGNVVRVPGDGLGGGGGVGTIVITNNRVEAFLSMIASGDFDSGAIPEETVLFCKNMTFEEAYSGLASGKPMNALYIMSDDTVIYVPAVISFAGNLTGEEVISFIVSVGEMNIMFAWTKSGIEIRG